MVGLGVLMLLLSLSAIVAAARHRLFHAHLLHLFALAMGPAGFVAVIAGWITAEAGRQPFTVYGLLRTAQSAAPIDAPAVASSLVVFAIVYFTVFTAGIVYILRLMSRAPETAEPSLDETAQGPMRSAGLTPASSMAAQADGARR
jgi:cytochrome d ubiquinol oxidase subunit I